MRMTGSSPGMGIGSCIGPVCTTGFCMVWAQPLGPRAISGTVRCRRHRRASARGGICV
jgi:hypothetical protein